MNDVSLLIHADVDVAASLVAFQTILRLSTYHGYCRRTHVRRQTILRTDESLVDATLQRVL